MNKNGYCARDLKRVSAARSVRLVQLGRYYQRYKKKFRGTSYTGAEYYAF